MLVHKKLAESEKIEPNPGTVMCYGDVYACSTKRTRVPAPYPATIYAWGLVDGSAKWVPRAYTSRFGRLIRMLPGRVCEMGMTPDEESHRHAQT